MNKDLLDTIFTAAEANQPVTDDIALAVLDATHADLPALLHATHTIRARNFGAKVKLCSIVNAKCGACSENCTFCAQSAHNPGADTTRFNRLDPDQLIAHREQASKQPVAYFGVVTSGEALREKDLEKIEQALLKSGEDGAGWCASLGCLTKEQLLRLKKAGLKRFHHNIETAESFFPEICDTHPYSKRLDTVRAALDAGLQVCCGGILGLGESREQRVEMADTLAGLGIDSIPLNFLVPIKGTKLENTPVMEPLDILLTIIMFRLKNPAAEIRLAAGRAHLRSLQSMAFHAGVTGIMIGDLLTITGQNVEQDIQMVRDLGLEPELPA